MNFKLILAIVLCLELSYTFAQSNTPIFLGIQPAVTIEPSYIEGELDVNILPIVLELSISNRVNFRILPTLNYHFGGTKQGISDIGFYTVFPVFLKNQENRNYPYGLYVGPVLGLGQNLINEHYTTTVAIEPGYFFKTKKRFTICTGLQLGGSYFLYDSQPNKWVFHWGPKVSLGFWIGNSKK